MRLIFIAIAVWLTGVPALSQVIVVRSGEHENFTRLVVPLPKGIAWGIEESNRMITLNLELPMVTFDVSQVFDRIPRKRVVSVFQEKASSNLVFKLACDCSVTSLVDNPEYIVIDIGDEKESTKDQGITLGIPIARGDYRFSNLEDRDIFTLSREVTLPEVIGDITLAPPPVAMGIQNNPQPAVSRNTINLSKERLLAQIARAANQGLLELAGSPSTVVYGGTQARDPEAEPPNPDELMPISLTVETSIDRDLLEAAATLNPITSGLECIDPNLVALSQWGSGLEYSNDIGKLRSQLYGEFDKLQIDIALDMARLNIFFGFGAEALQAVELSGVENRNTRVLRDIAVIIDSGEIPYDSLLKRQQMCESDVALWSLIVAETLPNEVNDRAISRAFLRLPLHLRSLLGPRVSQKYTTAGRVEMASSILRAMGEGDETNRSGVNLANASLAELRKDTKSEDAELVKSVEVGSEYSPSALIEIISNKYEARESVSPEMTDLVSAYTTEFGKAEFGKDLRRSLIIALALAGEFDSAFATLEKEKSQDSDRYNRSNLIPFLVLVTENANDVTFLRYALNSELTHVGPESSAIGLQMARRLLDLGFAENAEKWLRPPSKMDGIGTGQSMKAEIALSREQPRRALVELFGLKGAEVAKLRVAALWKSGEFQKAAQVLVGMKDFEAAARGFWLANNWAAVPSQADMRYAQVVEQSVRLLQAETDAEKLPPLAQARLLMENSSKVREGIEALLQEVSSKIYLTQ